MERVEVTWLRRAMKRQGLADSERASWRTRREGTCDRTHRSDGREHSSWKVSLSAAFPDLAALVAGLRGLPMRALPGLSHGATPSTQARPAASGALAGGGPNQHARQ